MIELFITQMFAHSDKLIAISLLIFLGLVLRITLQIFGQTWIRTKAHTATLLLLPIITYVITNVISGNIALSLGMVGALSIVRFRNPVRSPLELSVYFGAITMGIAASVSLLWIMFLVIAIFMAIISLIIVNKVSNNLLSVPFFHASFSEGNSLSTLSITTQENIDSLDENPLLQSKVVSNAEGKVFYYLSSIDFELLRRAQKEILLNHDVQAIELRR
ncbi:DUF4956 domain-containing protein [Pseudopelagicola sp. nBUS_20]|uniref:DUF4956 domain-containing protein n=1 Tax=Pseudopelagicola sp. nBUS_20 TaxID=3395317 RepID=UPI003EB87413